MDHLIFQGRRENPRVVTDDTDNIILKQWPVLRDLVGKCRHQRIRLVLVRDCGLEEERCHYKSSFSGLLQELLGEALHDGGLPMTGWASKDK
jgi:hypothetical protein